MDVDGWKAGRLSLVLTSLKVGKRGRVPGERVSETEKASIYTFQYILILIILITCATFTNFKICLSVYMYCNVKLEVRHVEDNLVELVLPFYFDVDSWVQTRVSWLV